MPGERGVDPGTKADVNDPLWCAVRIPLPLHGEKPRQMHLPAREKDFREKDG